jgi:hypothetical protein
MNGRRLERGKRGGTREEDLGNRERMLRLPIGREGKWGKSWAVSSEGEMG